MPEQHAERVPGIERHEDLGRLQDFAQSEEADRDEPDHHDRTEQPPDALRAAALHREQDDEDGQRAGHDEPLHGRVDDREPFHRAHHRDCGRDERIAVEERRAEHRKQHQPLRGPAVPRELVLDQCDQRQHAAFAFVVHPQDDDDVLERDDDQQAPEDERQHAEHGVDVRGAAGDRGRFSQRIERAGADVAIHDAERAERGRGE